MSKTKSRQLPEYPDVIKALPEADMPFPGVKAWIVQAPKHQLIFFEFEPTAVVPEHSHPYPQWGILLKGGMQLTVDGKTRTVAEGQEYLIPAGEKHLVKKFLDTTRVIDFFSEPARYKAKTGSVKSLSDFRSVKIRRIHDRKALKLFSKRNN